MIDLRGKWVFITGSSRGLGRLSAIYMASLGCNIILHSRTIDGTEKIYEEINALGVDAKRVEGELSDLSELDKMLKVIDDMNIDVDIVLNNAGYQVGYRVDYLNTPMSDYPISIAINTIAPMRICYHFLPKMIKKGFGRIVNTTSGINLEAEQAGYSAAKAALDKVTRDLGYKIDGTDVIISLADPGWCRTDLGGPKAPNSPESALPGIIIGALLNDKKSGRLFSAQEYVNLSLDEAIKKAEAVPSPYRR
ncbi:MAG: SDR family oxidoreductase [Acholeplasmatales bacterium]|nr:SDR family oxidoreductase [Acholeplasmatales bacterium]